MLIEQIEEVIYRHVEKADAVARPANEATVAHVPCDARRDVP